MTRNPFDLDLALLERRRWVYLLAEQQDRRYRRLWYAILTVLALGTLFILGGIS